MEKGASVDNPDALCKYLPLQIPRIPLRFTETPLGKIDHFFSTPV